MSKGILQSTALDLQKETLIHWTGKKKHMLSYVSRWNLKLKLNLNSWVEPFHIFCFQFMQLRAALYTSADAPWLSTFVVTHSYGEMLRSTATYVFFFFCSITFCHLVCSESKIKSYLINIVEITVFVVHERFWKWVCLWGLSLSRITTWGTGDTRISVTYLTN